MGNSFIFHTSPEVAFTPELLEAYMAKNLPLNGSNSLQIIQKRSIDARSREIKIRFEVQTFENELEALVNIPSVQYQDVTNSKKVIIVGAGPAGLFAALRSIELGLKPIIIERGKNVRERRRDLADIQKNNIVNPESNYCFGEGGAGTYSDGKLYTRADKRGSVKKILQVLVNHGANPEILFEAHPHIGTNKLPKLVEELRETILKYGGEIHFNARIVHFEVKGNRINYVKDQYGNEFKGEGYVLATGHSAKDMYQLLNDSNILLEAKPFALGVRIEHPQHIVDEAQYKLKERGKFLPPAAYSLVHQSKFKGVERGVFSFCMCPGGFIVPAATMEGELVVNGMSPSKRDSKYANSGTVVAINLEDLDTSKNPIFAGLDFQSQIEKQVWNATKSQKAPAQRLMDFINKKQSNSLPETSYIPKIESFKMDEFFPDSISFRLRDAVQAFGKKMKGYLTNEAILVGTESRTSSTIRIPRDKETLKHPQISNLFPCGEGAGFAGGIVSAAMDGERSAEALKMSLL